MRNNEIDIVVLGGGVAGVGAAIAAAQNGAKVRLIERYGFLGGTLTYSLVGALCGLFSSRKTPSDIVTQIIKGIAEDILKLASDHGGIMGPRTTGPYDTYSYDPYVLAYVLDELVAKHDVQISFHSIMTGAKASNSRINEIEVTNKSGKESITPLFVIDTTGDADVVAMTGGQFEKDIENLQPGTMTFRMSNIDSTKGIPSPAELKELIEKEKIRSGLTLPREDPHFIPTVNKGEVICAFSRVKVDGTDVESLSKSEIEGRKQVFIISKFLKEVVPAFENAYVSAIAPQIGIRESRRIIGEAVLTKDDVLFGKEQHDVIAKCGWPIERHVPGSKFTEVVPLVQGDSYDIPFGCLIPKEYANLLVAGRSISTTREAHASVRVFGPCVATGQAVGTAAALCIAADLNDIKELKITELQKKLISQGVNI